MARPMTGLVAPLPFLVTRRKSKSALLPTGPSWPADAVPATPTRVAGGRKSVHVEPPSVDDCTTSSSVAAPATLTPTTRRPRWLSDGRLTLVRKRPAAPPISVTAAAFGR